jgi:predicted DNA-binding ribbon-helix-helix protein
MKVISKHEQRRAPHTQKPVGEGTLKERAHQLSVYLEEPVYEELREIAHVERTKLHQLILEGINAVLKRRGRPSIKELTA